MPLLSPDRPSLLIQTPASSMDGGPSAALSVFRFSLASMVIATHLSGMTPVQTGRAAVEAFFCISGFLITMVATGRYDDRPQAFLANRFLRIYPTYWLCLAIALAVVSVCPNSVHIHPSLYAPATAQDLAANVAIFGLTQETASRLLPAAWSLHTELWFYVVIGLVTAARPRWTTVLLAISLGVSAAAVQGFVPISFYGTPLGNADAFFLGSAVWQHRNFAAGWAGRCCFIAGLLLFETLAWMPTPARPDLNVFFAAPATALLLLGLWNSGADTLFCSYRKYGTFLGRLSYPMFLLHWPFGALTSAALAVGPGWRLFAVSTALTIAASAAIVVYFERPLETYRSFIRRRAVEPAAQDQRATAQSRA